MQTLKVKNMKKPLIGTYIAPIQGNYNKMDYMFKDENNILTTLFGVTSLKSEMSKFKIGDKVKVTYIGAAIRNGYPSDIVEVVGAE